MTVNLQQKPQPAVEAHLAPSSSASHFLHPGQVHVSTAPESISLILGSCVAVCLWDPVSGIGGATHYLLPAWDGRGTSSPRYGNVAILALLQKLVDAGARRDQLRAKVFGGGCLFNLMKEGTTGRDHLGTRNVEVAKELLAKEHILIISSVVGGNHGKRVVFQTNTGDAVVKEL